MCGDAEQEDRRYLEFGDFVDLRVQLIDRQLRVPWHRANRAHDAAASNHEERCDQIVGAQYGFAHHATQCWGAA